MGDFCTKQLVAFRAARVAEGMLEGIHSWVFGKKKTKEAVRWRCPVIIVVVLVVVRVVVFFLVVVVGRFLCLMSVFFGGGGK